MLSIQIWSQVPWSYCLPEWCINWPDKVKAVREWPTPTDVTEVKSFLGLCSYYRRFIKDFATIAKPLFRLTEKHVPFIWKEDEQTAFETMKDILITAPVMAYPSPTATFILDTDASNVGIGAVLSQVIDGDEKVIAYGSRTLTKAERQYCVTRRELLAVVFFTKYFKHYLTGRKFLLRTDHASYGGSDHSKNQRGNSPVGLKSWTHMISTSNIAPVLSILMLTPFLEDPVANAPVTMTPQNHGEVIRLSHPKKTLMQFVLLGHARRLLIPHATLPPNGQIGYLTPSFQMNLYVRLSSLTQLSLWSNNGLLMVADLHLNLSELKVWMSNFTLNISCLWKSLRAFLSGTGPSFYGG